MCVWGGGGGGIMSVCDVMTVTVMKVLIARVKLMSASSI